MRRVIVWVGLGLVAYLAYFALTNAAGAATVQHRVVRRAPAIVWFRSNTASVPAPGGTVTLTARVLRGKMCEFGGGGSPPLYVHCSGGIGRIKVAFSANTNTAEDSWRFWVRVRGSGGSALKHLSLSQQGAPPPTVTGTSVSISVSSNAANNETTSLTVNYTATVSATCSYSNGTSAQCAIPSGEVVWTMIGGGQGGNFMYPSQEDLCPATVGGSTNSAECSADWNTYGDQFIGATFTSGSINVSQELETEVVAPVDLAQGLTFSNYQNAGPEAIGDCSMAAAADWIEATYNVSPDEASVVDAYWSAEDEYNGGIDVGLNQTQLFDYWRAYGISGSYLTGTLSVSIDETDVEDALSSGYVLISSVVLPPGFPLGEGQGGGHLWDLVGYSSTGPMIVSWGQEVQITWSEFNTWTQGVWEIRASS